MDYCCKFKTYKKIYIEKFEEFAEKIYKNNMPYTIDGDAIMICSPVGNHSKFAKSSIKADIMISDYSTSPSAAISYIEDIYNKIHYPELKNSFGTKMMQKAIDEMLKSLGFLDKLGILFSSLSPGVNPYFNIIFTQMLCMISKNGSSSSDDINELLKNSYAIKKQAEHSLEGWYKRIKNGLKNSGVILLMGHNSENLIKNAYFFDDNRIKIDFHNKQSDETLLDRLKKENYKIFFIMQSSAFLYPAYKELWLASPLRNNINLYLAENFPMYVEKIMSS